MNEHADELRTTLAKLHEQLQEAEDLDTSLRAELATTIDEIDDALDRAIEDHEGLLERLAKSTKHFEESHPALADAIARVSDLLSRIGM